MGEVKDSGKSWSKNINFWDLLLLKKIIQIVNNTSFQMLFNSLK
jgi:hypothetical protein